MNPRQPREPGCRVFTHELPVRPADIDAAGHLNHVAMVAFFEYGRVRAHREVRDRSPELPDMSTAVRRLNLDYLGQAAVFEQLSVRTWVLRDGGSSRTWAQGLVRADGTVIARAEVVSVLVDVSTGRPARLPEVYRHTFAEYVEGDG